MLRFHWKWKFEHVEVYVSLHAHAYKLMLYIVFMEGAGGQLTKYISGGCLMDNLIYFF